MTHGGPRKNAGRKPGASSEKTREVANRIAADGSITPLEVMIDSMRFFYDKAVTARKSRSPDKAEQIAELYARAADVASKAAPFIHPKLSNIEASIKGDFTLHNLTDDELDATIRSAAAEAGLSLGLAGEG